jgi:hypothetical protein
MAGQELPWDRDRMARLFGCDGVARRAVAARTWPLEALVELSSFGRDPQPVPHQPDDVGRQPSRRAYIPKADGRQRPLGIAALEDKIFQRAVVEVLNAVYEVDFRNFSYGYHGQRGANGHNPGRPPYTRGRWPRGTAHRPQP